MDELPPSLEKLDSSTPIKGVDCGRSVHEGHSDSIFRRGFLLCNSKQEKKSDKKSAKEKTIDDERDGIRGERSTTLKPDINGEITSIIREHYECDRFLKGHSDCASSSNFDPQRDLMEVLRCMQSDPQRAQRILEAHPDAGRSFGALMKKLGGFFDRLGDAERKEIKTGDSMPPLVQDILRDPNVGVVLKAIRNGSKIDPRLISQHNPETASKIHALISYGYLNVN